jgi:hypothetical protein
MNLIEKVYQEMSTDADGNDKQAVILKKEYIDATQQPASEHPLRQCARKPTVLWQPP